MAQQTVKVREFFFPYIIGNIGEIILQYSCANAALSFHQKMEVMMLDLGDKEMIKFKIKVKSFRFRNI